MTSEAFDSPGARFAIRRRLGSGGMGEVCLAHDAERACLVALKRLAPHLCRDGRYRLRLRREAERVMTLAHEHITATYEWLEVDDEVFLVMEYVDGVTLRERFGVPLTIHESLELAIECTEALGAAHTRGIVHHDIKPENIMLARPHGRVKVCDFGVARRLPDFFREDAPPDERDDEWFGGTLPYLAPEVILSRDPDGRADIFSLGVVLYEALAGRRPFHASQRPELREQILNRDHTPVTRLNPQVPRQLERIVARMLAKEPSNRYPSATDLHKDLLAVQFELRRTEQQKTEPIPKTEPPRPTPWAHRVTNAAVVVVLLVTVPYRPPPPPLPTPQSLAVLPFTAVGGDATHGAYCSGLTQALTSRLTKYTVGSGLQVASVTDVQRQRVATREDARTKLGATLALEGACERHGDSVRVTSLLVDARTGRQLRAASRAESALAALTLQEQVVEDTLRMVGLPAPAASTASAPAAAPNPAAYSEYLVGRGRLQEYGDPANIGKAAEAFQRAVALDNRFALAYAGLGEASVRRFEQTRDRKYLDDARKACDTAAALDETLAAAHTCLGDLHNRTGRYEEAVSEFRRAQALQPSDDQAYRGLALALERTGRVDEAEKTYREAIRIRPDYWAGYSWLGTFSYRRGRYKEAADQFTFAIALSPDNVQMYRNRGGANIFLGRYEEAVADLQKANALQRTEAGLTNLGQVYYALRKIDQAVAMFEEAWKLRERNFGAASNLASGYFQQPGSRDKATEMYRRAVKLGEEALAVDPRDGWVHVRLASLHAMFGDRVRAIEEVRRGIALQPDDNECAFFAGVTYALLGDQGTALSWLEKAVSLGYSIAAVRNAVELDGLQRDPRFNSRFNSLTNAR